MATKLEKLYKRAFEMLNWRWALILDALEKTPRDFAAKVRWRMKHDHNPLYIELQDKHKVKEFAQKRNVKVPATLYVTDRPETIPFDSLPESYVLKASHGCGWNILCKNGEFYIYKTNVNYQCAEGASKYKLNRDEVILQCQIWVDSVYSRAEWAYQHIPPMILIEEMLVSRDGGELKDFKFYVFNGVPKVILILSTTIRQNNESVMLDLDWKPFSLPDDKYKHPEVIPDKPDNLEEMLAIARRLGEGIDFVRVDLYDTTAGIILGEMTMYPEGGRINSPSYDKKFNRWLGDQWVVRKS